MKPCVGSQEDKERTEQGSCETLGAYGMYQFNVYVASLPPGEFVCGNGALGPFMLIMFGAPLLGLIGAGIAAALP